MALTSCEKLIMPKEKSKKATEVFEQLWKKMDQGYVYFDYKNIRWDSIYQRFKPSINDTMAERAFFDTCVEMLSSLQDGNVVLDAGFAQSYYNTAQNYPANFRRDILERYYWNGYQKTGPFLYKVIDSVGYIRYESFNDDINDAQVEVMIDFLKGNGGKKGAILDVRNNAGGITQNMFTLLNHIGIDSTYEYSFYLYKIAYKKGTEHGDMSDYLGSYIENNDKKKFGKKMVVLTNRSTYGMASIFATAVKSFPNAVVLGDTTGGGTGLQTSYELANGWVIHYTTSIIKSANGDFIENGVPPDTVVTMKPVDEALNKDSMIEAALAEIKK